MGIENYTKNIRGAGFPLIVIFSRPCNFEKEQASESVHVLWVRLYPPEEGTYHSTSEKNINYNYNYLNSRIVVQEAFRTNQINCLRN